MPLPTWLVNILVLEMEKLSEIVGCVLRDEEGSENKLVELVALLEEVS